MYLEITDKVIEAVPKIAITGLKQDEEEFLTKLHKEVLRTVLKLNYVNNCDDMEAGILIDLCTMKYWIIDGGHKHVSIKNNDEAYGIYRVARKRQLMFIHNHPTSNTFSYRDLNSYLSAEQIKIMSVVGNNGIIYVLIKKESYIREEAIDKLNEFMKDIISDIESQKLGLNIRDITKMAVNIARDKWLNDCGQYGLCYFVLEQEATY